MTRRAIFTVLCFFTGSPALGAELPSGVTLSPAPPTYFVMRDAFVRAAPDNAAARIDQVAKGQRVTVVGKAEIPNAKGANWLALKRPDGKIGFVFASALRPMIDGTLKATLEGNLSAPERPDCRYAIAFEGRTKISDDVQQTADYDVAFACQTTNNPALSFTAAMFITELPSDEKRDIYQINIDVLDMRVNMEDVLSVTTLYDPAAKNVSFERINDETLGSGQNIEAEPAATVPAALAASLKIAHRVWQKAVWDQLEQRPVSEPDIQPDSEPGSKPAPNPG